MKAAFETAAIWVAFLALLGYAYATSSQRQGKAVLRVVRASEQYVRAVPYIVPEFEFFVERGSAEGEHDLYCEQVEEERLLPSGVSYPAFTLECDGGVKMVLRAVDMTLGGR